ncbi:ABC transporter ATP-binding protein [Sesbania bispinosa]|nr:ABC transporter ATP-binding protein [Sesbania bispinosa]
MIPASDIGLISQDSVRYPQLPATGHRRFQEPSHHQPLHQIARITFLSSMDHVTVTRHVSNCHWDTRDSASWKQQASAMVRSMSMSMSIPSHGKEHVNRKPLICRHVEWGLGGGR